MRRIGPSAAVASRLLNQTRTAFRADKVNSIRPTSETEDESLIWPRHSEAAAPRTVVVGPARLHPHCHYTCLERCLRNTDAWHAIRWHHGSAHVSHVLLWWMNYLCRPGSTPNKRNTTVVTMLSTYLESTVPKRVSKSCGEGRLSTPERWAEASLCSSKLLQTRILQKAQ